MDTMIDGILTEMSYIVTPGPKLAHNNKKKTIAASNLQMTTNRIKDGHFYAMGSTNTFLRTVKEALKGLMKKKPWGSTP